MAKKERKLDKDLYRFSEVKDFMVNNDMEYIKTASPIGSFYYKVKIDTEQEALSKIYVTSETYHMVMTMKQLIKEGATKKTVRKLIFQISDLQLESRREGMEEKERANEGPIF